MAMSGFVACTCVRGQKPAACKVHRKGTCQDAYEFVCAARVQGRPVKLQSFLQAGELDDLLLQSCWFSWVYICLLLQGSTAM